MTETTYEKSFVLLVVGFGCLIGFARICASGFAGLLPGDAASPLDSRYVLRTASELAMFALLVVAGWKRWFALGPGAAIAATLVAAATAVVAAFAPPAPVAVLAAVLSGLSTAVLLYVWMLLLARLDVRGIVVTTLVGLLLAGLIVEGAPLLGGDLAFDVVAIAAIVAGAAALLVDPQLESCRPDGPLGEADAARVPWLTVVLVVACGFFAALLYGVASLSAVPAQWEPNLAAFEASTVVVILASVVIMLRSRAWMHVVWAPLFALFALAAVLACLPARVTVQLAVGFMMAAVFCASFLVWLVFPALLSSLEVPRTALAAALLACSSNSLATLAGSALGEALPVGLQGLGGVSGIFCVVVAALFAAVFIANRNRFGMVGMWSAEAFGPGGGATAEAGPAAVGADEAEEKPDPVDALKERLDAMAGRYGLTPRESEVALYTVQGFSCAYIADKLVVSNSTVRFHQQNIYRKFEVHSRNELIEFVSRSHDA